MFAVYSLAEQCGKRETKCKYIGVDVDFWKREWRLHLMVLATIPGTNNSLTRQICTSTVTSQRRLQRTAFYVGGKTRSGVTS